MKRPPLWLVLTLTVLLSLFWAACGQSASTTSANDLDSLAAAEPASDAPSEEMSMPSPIQMALSMLKSKAPYNSELLNPAKNADGYSNSFKQAFNLGVYEADLGYLIANHQTQEALSYFGAVKKLGDKLQIFGAFEDEMMKRAEANLESRDSLFAIVSEAFKHADVYLNENAMMASADLIVAGAWLESTYLATQILKTHDSGPLRKRVGEDKLVLPELLAAVSQHKDSPDHQALAARLTELNKIYDQIKIKHEDGASETDEATKVVKIGGSVKVRYTPAILAQITDKVAAIRQEFTH